jgi:hypothetical protein
VADKKAEILPSVAQKDKADSADEESSVVEEKPAVVRSELAQQTARKNRH